MVVEGIGVDERASGERMERTQGEGRAGRRRETTDTCLLKLLQNELLVFVFPSLMVSSQLENIGFKSLW